MNIEDDLTKRALDEVSKYIERHLDKSDGVADFGVFVVWQVCVLGNFKWLISSTLPDGMYYEVTYSRDKQEFYLDAYRKWENICIPR